MYRQIGDDEEFSELLFRFADASSARIDVGPGWAPLIWECHEKLFAFDPNYKIAQIKEKFGGLRYYFNPSNHVYTRTMHDRILPIEKRSYLICEVCGADGKLKKSKDTNWLKTLCNEHASGQFCDSDSETNVYFQKNLQLGTQEHLTMYPIVIRESRYGGTYEGGKWHAIGGCNSDTWNMDHFDYLNGDDDCAVKFWWESEAAKKVGVGETPNDALADLFKKNFI